MKKILLLLLLIMAGFQSFSQTPGISYQAVILNPNTKELPGANAQTSILANSKVAIRFTIINEDYEQEYQEFHLTKTDAYGMINLLIGHGTRISGSYFEDILWNGLSKKLKIDIDFSGIGNSFSLLSEQELTFMPQPALVEDTGAILKNAEDIITEQNRAILAESFLQVSIDENKTSTEAAIAINSNALAAEVIRATNAEAAIDSKLVTEVSNLTVADATLQTNIDIVQSDVDANETAANTAIAAVQSDVDSNETAANNAIAAVQTDVDANEAASNTADATLQTNINTVQSDVDENETAANTAIAAVQSDVDSNETAANNAIAAVQTDVDANEAASNTADATLQTNINTVQSDVDANETAANTAIAAVQLDVDANEAASNIADATLQTNINVVQSNVDENETATNNALNLKADIASPTFTGTVAGINAMMVGLGNVDNTSDADKPVSTATQTALDLKVDKLSGKGLSTEDYTTAEKTKLGAITGANTGDQDVSGIAINSSNIGGLTSLLTTNKSSVVAAINEIETNKADLKSPSFTGLPLAPTATAGTNTTQIATTAFVSSAVSTATATNSNFVTLNSAQTITGLKTFATRKINIFAQSYALTATMNIGFAPNGENLSSIAMGINALYTHQYGNRVIGIGNEALYKDLRGWDNIGIGYRTLYNMTDTNNDWGNRNIAIGSESGTNIIEGDNNTLIGTNSNTSTSVISNSSAIGYQAVVNANNTIQLGNTNVTLVNTSGSITSGGVITGTSIIKAGGTSSQFLMADGSVSTGAAAVREVADEFSATASQSGFTLTKTPSANSKVKMYVNGIRISNTAYSTSGATLTYIPANNGGYALTASDRIQMDYYY